MIIKQRVEVSNSWPTTLKPASEGVFGLVNLDYDQLWPKHVIEEPSRRYHVSRPTRNGATRQFKGLPAVARFQVDTFVEMNRDIQLWMHGLCVARVPGIPALEARNDWAGLMRDDRFITNRFGSTTCADYINGTNLNKEDMKLQPSACGGAILKITGEDEVGGEDCWEFEAIDCMENYRQFNPKDHWWLFYEPNNSVRVEIWKKSNGVLVPPNTPNSQWTGLYRENKADPFPHYRNRSIIPVWAVETNRNYLPKWRMRILAPGERPSPWVA